ncbi:hypothetical protein ACEWY4_026880 [Coilia grayii]|uniref:SEA domain-containing protein n=1 Tax=Coilia grayii TaxID=363190 RepID=A0ABD1ITW0_9TELE
MEFDSDLESSQFLLTDRNFRSSAPLTGHADSTHTSERRNRVQRAAVEMLADEGSGMLEGTITTTTTKPPVTTATTTTTTTTAITTTITTTTTATSNRPRFIVGVRVLLLKAFNSDFSNPQSSAYQQQTASVVSWCTPIYRRRYGSMFFRVLVISLRSSSRYRQDNTEVEIQVEFDQDAPETAPTSDDVVLALKQEASSSNPLSVDTDNIVVTRAPRVTPNARFTTNETFVLSLLTINSTSFRDRASFIKKELEPFFQEDYSPDFICLTPKSFSVGTVYPNSILHLSDLCFTYNATLPSATAIYNTMLRAARSGKLSLDIISVNGTSVSASSSGDISSKISLFTTCSLTLLSLLVTRPW